MLMGSVIYTGLFFSEKNLISEIFPSKVMKENTQKYIKKL